MSVILRERKLPSGKIQLYLDCYYKRQRTTEALRLYLSNDRKKNQEVRRLAEAVRAKRELQFHNEVEGFFKPIQGNTNVFVFAESVYGNKSALTQRTYINTFQYLQVFSKKDLFFENITPDFCERFKTFLLKNLKQNSAAAYYERFRIVLKRAVKEGILVQNPTEGISIKITESLPKYLSEEQLRTLLNTKCENENIRHAFIFSCLTGLRYGDIKVLQWKQIKSNTVELTQQKTGIAQTVPLHGDAIAILVKQKTENKKTSDYVFVLPRRSTIDKALKRWAKRAGLDLPLSFHKARHTFSTLMLSRGNDIYTVSKILGHKSLSTTQIYARVIDEQKRIAINRLPNFMEI